MIVFILSFTLLFLGFLLCVFLFLAFYFRFCLNFLCLFVMNNSMNALLTVRYRKELICDKSIKQIEKSYMKMSGGQMPQFVDTLVGQQSR
jgi:predicted membrane protein